MDSTDEQMFLIECSFRPEWAVTQAQMNKYGQLFNTIDRNKHGYLTGFVFKCLVEFRLNFLTCFNSFEIILCMY